MEINKQRFFDQGDGTLLVVPMNMIEQWVTVPSDCTVIQQGEEKKCDREYLTSEGQLTWLNRDHIARDEAEAFLPLSWMNLTDPLSPKDFFNHITHYGDESEEVAVYFNGSIHCAVKLDPLNEVNIENPSFVEKKEVQFAREYLHAALVQHIFSALVNGVPSTLTITESQFPGLNTAEVSKMKGQDMKAFEKSYETVIMKIDPDNLRKYRKLRKYSLDDLANIIQISPELLDQYESGKKDPKPKTLRALVSALDVPVTKLLKEEGTEASKNAVPSIAPTPEPEPPSQDQLIALIESLHQEIKDLRSMVEAGQNRINELYKVVTKSHSS